MDDLSLHILDIAENSINAGANKLKIKIIEDTAKDIMIIEIEDDGSGMEEEFLKSVENPFVTTRTTRKVGLGISLLKEAAEITGGSLKINSEKNKGTKIKAVFINSSIDKKPLGKIEETIISLILYKDNLEIDFIYEKDGQRFEFKTSEIKEKLNLINLNNVNILNQLKELLKTKISEIQ